MAILAAFIQFSLCCFFALALWLILLLGGELFSTIGIEILADLLDEPWVSIQCLPVRLLDLLYS